MTCPWLGDPFYGFKRRDLLPSRGSENISLVFFLNYYLFPVWEAVYAVAWV